MKLTDSLDRACARRMRSAARPRQILIAAGLAVAAMLTCLPSLAAAHAEKTGASTALASTGLLGALAFTGPLREEDPGAPQGGGTKADPSGGDDPKLTIGQRLSSALASKATLQATIAQRDAKIAEHDQTIATLTQERDDARADLVKANARIAALEADAAEVEKALKTSEAEVEDLKGKATTVEKKAQEKVASLGFPAAKLPGAQDGGTAEHSSDAIFERFQSEANPEKRAALYREHQKALARERAAVAA